MRHLLRMPLHHHQRHPALLRRFHRCCLVMAKRKACFQYLRQRLCLALHRQSHHCLPQQGYRLFLRGLHHRHHQLR